MNRPTLLILLLFPWLCASAAEAPDPMIEIRRNAGDTEKAAEILGAILRQDFPADLFTEFDAGRVARPSPSADSAAGEIMSLQRMGAISVHSDEVKRAFTYLFLTAFADEARGHEALALYERVAVANSEDPFWRLIRARCARLMGLPGLLELYGQVAADMAGVPPSEDVRKIWEANRAEFELPAYTKEAWMRQSAKFTFDATGPDVPGSPAIVGSPFPFMEIAEAVGNEASAWLGALEGSPNAEAKALDDIMVQAAKFGELPWKDGRGFLNTERALSTHLLALPPEQLAALRSLQEAGFTKALTAGADPAKALSLFRRYPWADSAQRLLLQSAQEDMFQGASQSAFRSFRDVLRHAEARDLREQAQVGLWVSLAQFADPETVARAFDGADADATWPWNGKRGKAAAIAKQLVVKISPEVESPALDALRFHTIRIPPIPPDSMRAQVFGIDMQRLGKRLLVSAPMMLAMFDAGDPKSPLWSHTRRLNRHPTGAAHFLPAFFGDRIITRWGGSADSDIGLVALAAGDGSVLADGDATDAHSRILFRPMGSPVIADNRVFTVQAGQSFAVINRWPPDQRNAADVGLSCFDAEDMAHRWTQAYDAAQVVGEPQFEKSIGAEPVVSEGAVYFCSNSGRVVRSDIRDGEMEWMHFFRPVIGDDYRKPPSPWCLGSAPIVTEDKVICMPKYSGYLFALDKETGRQIWETPLLRGLEVLGLHGDRVLVMGANSLFAIDVETGAMLWGRRISEKFTDGFQLPRAQLVGSSVFCGTKNTLYRFDANGGALLESRGWEMGGEAPMGFHIAGADAYVVSDLPLPDETLELQLISHHTVTYPAADGREMIRPIEREDGTTFIWRDTMLMCFRGEQLVWSRFVSNAKVYESLFDEKDNELTLRWDGAAATYDAETGRLLGMSNGRLPVEIGIGVK